MARRGQIISRGPERWLVRVFLGRVAGKRKYLSQAVRGGKKDAERALTRLLRQKDAGSTVAPSTQTLAHFLEHWLQTYAALTVAPTTLRSYQDTVRLHLTPGLGHLRLRDLGPAAIQRYLSSKLEAGLSPTTVRYHARVLHAALKRAMRWGLLDRNPAALIDLPRKERREMRVLDEEQTKMFLAEAKRSSRYYPLYLAAVTTGAREGELLALTWPAVDFITGTATIQQTMCRLSGRTKTGEAARLLVKPPKTAASARTLILPSVVIETLQALREEQRERRRLTGDCPKGRDCRAAQCAQWHDWGLVFAQPNGKPLHAHNIITRDLPRVLALEGLRAELWKSGVPEEALPKGLPRIRFHDLRHGHASIMAAFTPLKVLSERLGHASTSTTANTYAHVLPGMQEQAVRTLETRLFGDAEVGQTPSREPPFAPQRLAASFTTSS